MLSFLLGIPWPEGDPKVCREAAGYWRAVAATAGEVRDGTDRSGRVLAEAGSAGESYEAFQRLRVRYSKHLGQITTACRTLADALDAYANELEKAQREFIVLAEKLIVDIGVTVLFGFVTVGISHAVTALRIIMIAKQAWQALTGLAWVASRAAELLTYYVLDSLAYTAVDQGALALVDVANDRSVDWKPEDFRKGFVANMAFDAAYDIQQYGVETVTGKKVGRSIPVRAVMRFFSSAFAYTPAMQLQNGSSELTPDTGSYAVKATIHLGGRAMVDAAVFSLLRRK